MDYKDRPLGLSVNQVRFVCSCHRAVLTKGTQAASDIEPQGLWGRVACPYRRMQL